MKETIEELIYNETQQRLNTMSQPDYQFPPKATRRDYLLILALACASGLLILLCMLGVIV